MAKIIKNVTVNWSWTGDNEALKGFNIALCRAGQDPPETPLTGSTVFASTSDATARSYLFKNVTLDTGVIYEPYVQAIYEGKDSDWIKTGGGSVPDDGINTVPIKSQVDVAATTATINGSGQLLTPSGAGVVVDNSMVQVGGRNLIKNSRKVPVNNAGSVAQQSDGSWTSTDSVSWNRIDSGLILYTPNTEYTFSISIKRISGSGGGVAVYYGDGTNYVNIPGTTNLTNDYKVYSVTKVVNPLSSDNVYLLMPSGDVQVQWVKMEKGNKATDWTPAPEDVEGDIAVAATTATWENVGGTGRPLDNAGKVVDTRSTNELPAWYPMGITTEFKNRVTIGAPGTAIYGLLETQKPWTDGSGGIVYQWFYSADGTFKRTGFHGGSWYAWTQDIDRSVYTGDLDATKGATWGSNINGAPYNSLLNNLLDPSIWVAGTTGSVGTFYVSGGWDANSRVFAFNPYGQMAVVWEGKANGNNSADGGWSGAYYTADKNMPYRYTCWVRVIERGNGVGGIYFGCSDASPLGAGESTDTNPYFVGGYQQGNLTVNKWYLMVGYLHPYGYTLGSTGKSGIYDPATGAQVMVGNEWKMLSFTTGQTLRTFLYYSTDSTVRVQFWNPMVVPLLSNVPSIEYMMSSTALLNKNQQWSDVGGAGKPEDNATVGATWNTDLAGIPARLADSPLGSGVQLNETQMGLYTNSNWLHVFEATPGPTYGDAQIGDFTGAITGTAGGLYWSQANKKLTIKGDMSAGSIRGVDIAAGALMTQGSVITDYTAGGASTINLKNTTDFNNSGQAYVHRAGSPTLISFTGKTATSLTGVTGLTYAVAAGTVVVPFVNSVAYGTKCVASLDNVTGQMRLVHPQIGYVGYVGLPDPDGSSGNAMLKCIADWDGFGPQSPVIEIDTNCEQPAVSISNDGNAALSVSSNYEGIRVIGLGGDITFTGVRNSGAPTISARGGTVHKTGGGINQPVGLYLNKTLSTGFGTTWDKLIDMADFPQVTGTTGHVKLPGGLLLKWGRIGNGTAASVPSSGSVTFDTTIPFTAIYSVWSMSMEPSTALRAFQLSAMPTTTGFSYKIINSSAALATTDCVFWVALGLA